MSYIPLTLLAYLLNSVSITIDKFLLARRIPNAFFYVFYISLFSLPALFLLPWTQVPGANSFILASLSTLIWTSGAYYMFKALQTGQAARVIPVVGTLIPIILGIFGYLTNTLSLNQIWGILFLVLALGILIFPYLKGKFTAQEAVFELVSALLFADSYIILRQAYLMQDFLTVFVWSRVVLVPFIVLIFFIPKIKRKVLSAHQDSNQFNFKSLSGALFLLAQVFGGGSELLLTFSISLANPALVNSLQGTQYIFLFIFALILSKKYPTAFNEHLNFSNLLSKGVAIILIVLGLYILSFSEENMKDIARTGVTYSPRFARYLELNDRETYKLMLRDLKLERLRFPVYWDEVEKEQGKYDFSDVDFYLNEAQKNGVEVVLTLGYKAPRWPECYLPGWAEKLTLEEKRQRLLEVVQKEVEYFRKYPNIRLWQVENEPFLSFGSCPQNILNYDLVKKEVEIVKRSDQRPVLITDSGELSSWLNAYNLSDVFGTTMYRTVWNEIFGQINYPTPPVFYAFKNSVVKLITGRDKVPVIISELQTEPWVPDQKGVVDWEVSEQVKAFPAKRISDNLDYANKTGFSEVYLWGVEWWYWMAKMGHPEYVEQAKLIFKQPH